MVSSKMRKPKHREIFDYLHSAIVEGRYVPGQRIPSETQLSRRFDVSRPTVARALRDLEHAGFLDRRVGSGSYVRALEEAQHGVVGILVPGLGEGEIFEPICSEIAKSVEAHNLSVLWGDCSALQSEGKASRAEQICKQYIASAVAGVFFEPIELAPGMHEANQLIVEALDRAGIPVILIDCDVSEFPNRSKFDVVGIDNHRAGHVLADHLWKQGCRRIDFVAQTLSAWTIDARIGGYREALIRRGVAPEEDWLHHVDPEDVNAMQQVARSGADGFICGNDYTAAHLMRNLMKCGVRIPEDVRVVGVDDLKYAKLLTVPLTTLRQPCRELGSNAVDAMIRRIENPQMPARDILLDFKLVVRESSAASPK